VFRCARWKQKKAKTNQAETGGTQQLGNISMPKQGEALTGIAKRPRSEDSISMERVRPSKRPRNIYKEVLMNIRIASLQGKLS
jgi:hypothetical protein